MEINKYLKSWLTFNHSPTEDAIKSNNWTTYGNPTIGTANAINSNALQLDGQSYIKLSNVDFGGSSFTIDGWCYVDSSSPSRARLISIVNPTNGIPLLVLWKSASDSTKLEVWANSYADVSQDRGNLVTASNTSVGTRVHFRLSTGTVYGSPVISISINGVYGYFVAMPSNGYNQQKFDIYVGANQNGGQGLIGSIDELCIYHGIGYASNYTVPTADFYKKITFDTGTRRDIKNPTLTWRYENPGTADLLTQAGTTVTNLTETQSKTGIAFYQPTRAKCFDIPATKEIWIKCDIYTTANYADGDRIRIYSADSSGVNGWCTQTPITTNYQLWKNGSSYSCNSFLSKNKNRSFLLHMISDATNGVVECFFESGSTDKFTGNVNDGNDFNNVYIQMDGSNILVSNVIISNAPLEVTEDVAELRLKKVEFLADTLRRVTTLLNSSTDTERNVVNSAQINLLMRRDIVKSANLAVDTERELYRTTNLFFDTVRNIYSRDREVIEKFFDVARYLSKDVTVENDTARQVNKAVEFFNDTECKILKPVEPIFDAERKIVKSEEIFNDTARNVMQGIWRYENYGTSALTRVKDDIDYVVNTNKSRTGYAIYPEYHLNQFDLAPTNEVWIKFDFYFEVNSLIGDYLYNEISFGDYCFDDRLKNQGYLEAYSPKHLTPGESYIFPHRFINANLPLYSDPENNAIVEDLDNPIEHGRLYRALAHLKSDSINGIIEFWLDDGHYLSYSGNVNNGNNFTNIFISSDDRFNSGDNASYLLVSNIIISNAPVSINEDVAEVGGEIEVSFATVRNVKNPLLKWTYENYGTADLLAVEGTTVKNLDSSRSLTGSAYITSDTSQKTFETPPAKEVWITFDFYVENIAYFDVVSGEAPAWSIFAGNISGKDEFDSGSNSKEYSDGVNVYTSATGVGYNVLCYDYAESKHYLEGYDKSELPDLNSCLLYMRSGETDGIIKFWINGTLKTAHIGNINNGDNFTDIVLYAKALNGRETIPLISNVLVSNSEIIPAVIFNDTDLAIKKSFDIFADTQRRINYLDLWRYENYGTANLLAVTGTTQELTKSASKFCTGFYSIADRQNYFDISATKEVWIKFDFWFTQIYETLFVGSLDDEKTNQVRLNCTGANGEYARIIFALAENVTSDTTNQFNQQQRYSAVVHLKSGVADGKIELTVSDGYNLTYIGNVNNGNDFENIYIQASNYNNISTYPLVSNVIVSNIEVGITENTKMPLVSRYDFCRSIRKNFEKIFDIKRNVVAIRKIFADLARFIKYSGNLESDTLRNVIKSVQIDCDMARTIPRQIMISPIESVGEIPEANNVTDGTQSIEINLSAQQLTDQINYTSTISADIMEQFQGKYLDYVFDVRIEQVKRKGVLYSYQCCSDIDELLYKQLDYKIPDNERWHRTDGKDYFGHPLPESEQARKKAQASEPQVGLASVHIQKISETLGKNPIMYFDDFVSTVDVEAGGATYQDLIGNIFGWTSRVPTMLINVFLRGNNLFVVQRGREPNTIDLTNSKHTLPIVTKELVRTSWGANVWSKTETRERNPKMVFAGYDFAPDPSPSAGGSGSDTDKATGYEYDEDGLVKQSEKEEGSTKTITNYTYVTIGKRKYLAKEETSIYEKGALVDTTVTTHTYLGQGQSHSQTYDSGGDYLGGSVGQNIGDDRVTPFTERGLMYKIGLYTYDENGNKKYIQRINLEKKYTEEERTIYGLALFDASFPVHGDEMLQEITNTINWLNRRTKETVSMTIYDYPHLIDFTDRIVFGGGVYFLESNTATKTSRIVNQQNISMVRWF